ncbi:enoyl-CoA hydratase [Actinomadura sp. LD22]|uniref:Enoyl-CoA hydratase n=1 Tax=Actinomadura physcomitrii TaxID=2650748 RepID=A0A6I4M1U9_9ACTN|nr:crotonase/enoyl-CoA hydratase family protein [Actinomadura physcomitrii]MVZ99927.1 enoyl-CoA hydratase [Actinomadura physcomitrii]
MTQMAQMYETLLYDVTDHIATITLNRPEKLNSFTMGMRDDLIAAFDRTDADDDVRAVIVTGAGRAFCAGADLSGGGFATAKRGGDEQFPPLPPDSGGMVTLRVFASRKPVIAAINGAGVGIGATMPLAMDIRLVSEKAKIGFLFARRGIVPDGASSWFLPRVVGIGKATEWALTGRMIQPREMLRAGLVSAVHAPEDLLPAARAVAKEIAENVSPVSAALTRQLLWRMLGAEHPMTAHVAESRALFERARGADAAEGVASFLEKRPPEFPLSVSRHTPDIFDRIPYPQFPDERVSQRYLPTKQAEK